MRIPAAIDCPVILIDLDNDEVRITPKDAVKGVKPFRLVK